MQLLGQCGLLAHKVVAQFLTQVLQILLFGKQLLLFLLQLGLLALCALTAQECTCFHFLLEIQYVLLEGLILLLERFGFGVQFDHRLLILALQLVGGLYGKRVLAQNGIGVNDSYRQQLALSFHIRTGALLAPRIVSEEKDKQGNNTCCQY